MPDPSRILLPETAAMKRALSRLRFLDREVILLKARDGLTYQQIGALLGLSPAVTERRFASALVKLRIALEPRRRLRWRR